MWVVREFREIREVMEIRGLRGLRGLRGFFYCKRNTKAAKIDNFYLSIL